LAKLAGAIQATIRIAKDEQLHASCRNIISAMPIGTRDARAIMRWIIAALYATAGVAHFAVPEKLLSITPSWVPFAPKVIFLTGVFEFAASFALITRPFRFWAGIAMAIYAICVWPANFKHAMNGIDLPYVTNSWLYHGPRLAFQPVIVWWALYSAGVIDWPWRRKDHT
jgi:uncharacterized membrane protein